MLSKKENLPLAIETPGGTMQVLANQGGMAIARYHFTADSDFSPLLAALPGGSCRVPHWGYVLSGRMDMEYADGTREAYEAGHVYYQAPGHCGGRVAAGTEIVEFSPEPDYANLIEAFKRLMGG